jgi:hypothetical protein
MKHCQPKLNQHGKTSADEFRFIQAKLENIAVKLMRTDTGSLIEAAFTLGCLHSVCIQNSIAFEEDVPESSH